MIYKSRHAGGSGEAKLQRRADGQTPVAGPVSAQTVLQVAPVSLYAFFFAVPDSPIGADPDTSGLCTLYKYASEDYIKL